MPKKKNKKKNNQPTTSKVVNNSYSKVQKFIVLSVGVALVGSVALVAAGAAPTSQTSLPSQLQLTPSDIPVGMATVTTSSK